jgi:hypothetical protein
MIDERKELKKKHIYFKNSWTFYFDSELKIILKEKKIIMKIVKKLKFKKQYSILSDVVLFY